MGSLVETADVDHYLLSLADQGKRTSVFHFEFAENKWKFAVSVFRLQSTNRSCHFPLVPFSYISRYILKRQQICKYIDIQYILYTYIYVSISIFYMPPFQTGNGSPGDFPGGRLTCTDGYSYVYLKCSYIGFHAGCNMHSRTTFKQSPRLQFDIKSLKKVHILNVICTYPQ